jgi:phosphoglucomutase
MSDPLQHLDQAVSAGHLLPASAENIRMILGLPGVESYVAEAIGELVENGQWTELNDRFYQTLKFGTGGLRGRSVGKVVTKAEQGRGGPNGRPEFPCAGTNAMNYFNVGRSAQGLVNYLLKQFPGENVKIVVSHDTRHFSKEFARLVAETASLLGATAYLFTEERSTPELSFAVRHLRAHAGVMITASHNPPHDNGFKAYYRDGGQLVEPQASAIIREVLAVRSGRVEKPAAKPGRVVDLGREIDEAYLKALGTLILEPGMIRDHARKVRFVFTALHGTGIKVVPEMLERFGFTCSVEKTQAEPDGRFPTVSSPNPENSEALAMGVEQARREKADVVFATDPDADRMGVAVRDARGEYVMLTGNQIGSIMAAYRLERLFAQGVLNPGNAGRAALIKTFVTTDLQKSMAEAYGVKCVETLTGFKYIGEKLKDYEMQAGGRGDESAEEWRARLLEKSTFFVFGGEESYGYSGGDYVRDKDANAAVLMCAEAAVHAAVEGRTLLDYLDGLYVKHGFYSEKLGTLTFEGADGAARIRRLLDSYQSDRPAVWGGMKVEALQNFAVDSFRDIDGKEIPKELMLMFHLQDGYRVAVRGSGTEPKIKFYFFGRARVGSASELESARSAVKARLDGLWEFTREDAGRRAG